MATETEAFSMRKSPFYFKIKYQIFILMAIVIVFLIVSLSISLYLAGRDVSMENTLNLSQIFTQQSITNLQNAITQFDVNCFQLYSLSSLPELMQRSATENKSSTGQVVDLVGRDGLYMESADALDVKILKELANLAYSSTAIVSIYAYDNVGNGYYLNKRGISASADRTQQFLANIPLIEKAKPKSRWSLYKDNIVIERMLFSKTGSTQVGYISVEYRERSFKDILGLGIDKQNRFALFNEEEINIVRSEHLSDDFIQALSNVVLRREQSGQVSLVHDGNDYVVVWATESTGQWVLVNVLLSSSMSNMWSKIIGNVIRVGILTFVLSLFSVLAFMNPISKKVNRLMQKMDQIAMGNFRDEAAFRSSDEFGQISSRLQNLGYEMDKLITESIRKEERNNVLTIRMLETRLKALNSQFNPHFIYNAMESVSSMALIDGYSRISVAVCSFSELLRLNISRQSVRVMLYDEINYVRKYLEVIKIVYPGRVRAHFELDESLCNLIVPSFILHPLIENCVVHNVEKSSKVIEVEVVCKRTDLGAELTVSDTGMGMNSEEIETVNRELRQMTGEDAEYSQPCDHIGLFNVNQMIKIMYGPQACLLLSGGQLSGLCVQIILPFGQALRNFNSSSGESLCLLLKGWQAYS